MWTVRSGAKLNSVLAERDWPVGGIRGPDLRVGLVTLDGQLCLRDATPEALSVLVRLGPGTGPGRPLGDLLRQAVRSGPLTGHRDDVDSWLASLRLHGQADGSFELSDGHLLRMSACTLPSSAIGVMVVCSVSEGESANLAMAERDRLGATLDALRDRAMALDGARKATEARLQEAMRRAELAEARATELEAMAHTDPLTGLLNRRRLLDLARIEIARARRHGRRLAILLVDVDRFKQVNDALGHRAGDAVLQDISRVCAARLRACDLLARWGGEEFLVVLPDTDPAGARRAAERLRIAVDGAPRGQGERSLRLTVSIGYAELLQGENCIGPAVDRADAALYAAKTSGRNRIVGI